jgi:hypothetical protein
MSSRARAMAPMKVVQKAAPRKKLALKKQRMRNRRAAIRKQMNKILAVVSRVDLKITRRELYKMKVLAPKKYKKLVKLASQYRVTYKEKTPWNRIFTTGEKLRSLTTHTNLKAVSNGPLSDGDIRSLVEEVAAPYDLDTLLEMGSGFLLNWLINNKHARIYMVLPTTLTVDYFVIVDPVKKEAHFICTEAGKKLLGPVLVMKEAPESRGKALEKIKADQSEMKGIIDEWGSSSSDEDEELEEFY